MQIYMIWVHDETDNVEWMVDAWDEYSIDANNTGWRDAIKKAQDTYTDVRVLTTTIDADKVRKAFAIADVTPEPNKREA